MLSWSVRGEGSMVSEPSGFQRPPAWQKLSEPSPAQVPDVPIESPRGKRRRRRAKRADGLGTQAAGPDFRWPRVAAGPAREIPGVPPPTRATLQQPAQATPLDDAAPTVAQTRQRLATSRRSPGGPRGYREQDAREFERARRAAIRSVALLFGLLALLVILGVVGRALVSSTRPVRPVPTATRSVPSSSLGTQWTTSATSLRPDLAKAELMGGVDGTFDERRVIDAGSVWGVLTGDADDSSVWVHGLDPSSGRELWKHALDDGLCAKRLLGKSLLCASAIEHDPATGLGTRWHLALLDPASGAERRSTDWTGWLALLHVDGARVLLVEQRQPAPHAVLTVLDETLQQRAQFDLRDQSQHDGMFSDNRIYHRTLPIPAGPALDRPRIRTVADGLTALWVGQTTAFVDLDKPSLVGVPRCSRLVDDGKRLWCNQGSLAAALSYALKPLYETDLGTRLAFPDRDPRAGDVADPVFLRSDGAAVRVDLTTGRTAGPLVDTRNGSAFGLVTSPHVAYADGLTLVWDSSTLFAVRARTGELLWQSAMPASIDDVYAWDGRLLLTGYQLRVLDPATGTVVRTYRQSSGLYTHAVGQVLVGAGPDEVARLVNP